MLNDGARSAIGTCSGISSVCASILRMPGRSMTATVLTPASVLFGAPIRRSV
jgi:hypothetical protein